MDVHQYMLKTSVIKFNSWLKWINRNTMKEWTILHCQIKIVSLS